MGNGRQTSWIKLISLPLATAMLLNVGACRGGRDRTAEPSASATTDDPTSELTLNNLTLEQTSDDGLTLWRVNADKAVYSQDRQVAQIENPSGEFFRDDQPAIRFTAESGEVRGDGEQLFLRGAVVATDIESGAVLKGNEVEWLPETNVISVRGDVTGTHPEYVISSDEAEAFIEEQRVELTGNIVGTSEDANVRLNAEHLIWYLEQEKVVSDRPFRIQQLANRRVTNQASADQAEFNLATQVVSLQQNGLVITQNPPLRVTGDSLTWDIDNETVNASQPITIVHRGEQTTAQGDRGQGNLATNIFTLIGNVQAVAQRNQSRLTANRLTWNVATQNIEANGDVTYRQVDPVLNLRGPRAVGKLENQTIVVSGGRVVTEIIPETNN
jgi:LPS export ABC transporter protein LptC